MDIRLDSYHNADSLTRGKAGTHVAEEQADLIQPNPAARSESTVNGSAQLQVSSTAPLLDG
jgi:hypothetical protein